ncbi:MAG TPA: tetratricopeptide repeat protein, partial [Streptosporangiaceae bacterium]|nr:tetratricopeptide repeat protein [Streptosporangiaceae bacterium]
IRYAQIVGNQQAEGVARSRLGDTFRRQGRTDEAIASLVAATEIFQQLNDVSREAISLRTTGQLLDQAGRSAEAVQTLQTALTRFQSLDDTPMSALTMSDLGHALLEAGEPATAVGILQDALGLIRRQDYPQAEATTLQRLGLALRRVGRLAEAVNALQDAMNIFNEIGDQESAEQALDLMDQILVEASAPAKAPRSTSPPNSAPTGLAFYLVCDASGVMAGAPIGALHSSITEMAAGALPGIVPRYPVSVIEYSNSVYSLPTWPALGSLPSTAAMTTDGPGDYRAVFEYLHMAIRNDAKTLKAIRQDPFVPIIYFVAASPPLADNWDASWRKLVYTAATERQPVILAFGLGDADEVFIRQIATFNAFMAEPDTDPTEAVRTIVARLTTSLINSADGAPDLPTSLPGFQSIAPKFGIVGNK